MRNKNGNYAQSNEALSKRQWEIWRDKERQREIRRDKTNNYFKKVRFHSNKLRGLNKKPWIL